MLISAPIIVLGSRLAVLVADDVPRFDIERGCRLDNAASSGMAEEQPVKRCVSDERKALEQLRTEWSQYAGPDRVTCTISTNSDGTPSYVELRTCLQDAKEARALSK